MNQTTIARSVSSTGGAGLHTAARSTVRLLPAPADTGFTFVRVDLPGKPRVAALSKYRVLQPRRTAIESGEATVHTVEHLISAAVGLGVDNLLVEIDGPEIPGHDGSATKYVELIHDAGLVELDRPRRPVVVTEPVEVKREDGAMVLAMPNEGGLKITYTLDYGMPSLQQVVDVDLSRERYVEEIAPARTFCLKIEAEMLQAAGLGQGANFDNTVVYDWDGPINGVQLRLPDEAARHKILDLIGDLALLGRPLHAHVLAMKSGHDLNLALVQALEAKYPT